MCWYIKLNISRGEDRAINTWIYLSYSYLVTIFVKLTWREIWWLIVAESSFVIGNYSSTCGNTAIECPDDYVKTIILFYCKKLVVLITFYKVTYKYTLCL